MVLFQQCGKIKYHSCCALSNSAIINGIISSIINYFSKEVFKFWFFLLRLIFGNIKNIWAILENLSHETKNLKTLTFAKFN